MGSTSRFQRGRTDEGQYLAATATLDGWAPPTCKDFVRKFLAIYGEGGAPNAERSAMLVEQAKRLLSAEDLAVNETSWDSAMRGYTVAREAENSFECGTWRPASDAAEAGGPSIGSVVNDEMERLQEVRCDAEDRLIATPAPSWADAIWKIEFSRKRWADFPDWPTQWWDAIIADLTRLGGGTRER